MNKIQASEKIWDIISDRQYSFQHVDGFYDLICQYRRALLSSDAIKSMLFQEFDDGSFYIGGASGGNREGLGTAYYSNGNFYMGQWHNDKYDGKGFFFNSSECFYGDFHNGNYHGDFLIVGSDEYIEAVFENDNIVKVKRTLHPFSFNGKHFDENGNCDSGGCLGVVVFVLVLLGICSF